MFDLWGQQSPSLEQSRGEIGAPEGEVEVVVEEGEGRRRGLTREDASRQGRLER